MSGRTGKIMRHGRKWKCVVYDDKGQCITTWRRPVGYRRPFRCYITQGGRGVGFLGKKRYEGVRFNVISITRGWVGQIPRKKSIT